jgi:hypothetical protein
VEVRAVARLAVHEHLVAIDVEDPVVRDRGRGIDGGLLKITARELLAISTISSAVRMAFRVRGRCAGRPRRRRTALRPACLGPGGFMSISTPSTSSRRVSSSRTPAAYMSTTSS